MTEEGEEREKEGGQEGGEGRKALAKGELKYYIALFSYNPTFHSPNEETDEELGFREGDIITVSELGRG